MKQLLTFISILMYSQLCAQTLNQYGHFIDHSNTSLQYSINSQDGRDEIRLQNVTLKGSSAFKTANGFLTSSGNYENAPATLRLYTKNGKERFSKTFDQTINLKISNNKRFCAFHDMQRVNILDIINHDIKTIGGSNVFDVSNSGNVAVFDEKSLSVKYDHNIFPVNEPVYKIIFFKNQPLFISRQRIFLPEGSGLKTVFETTTGRVFDVAVFSDKLYISIKKEMQHEFEFTAYKSDNLTLFTPVDQTYLKRNEVSKNKNASNPAAARFNSLPNEAISNPINFFNDTVYQPVGNSYSEIQEYNGAVPYLHPGVDLLGNYHDETRSVKKGYVKAVLTTSAEFHWRIAIANENTANQTQGYLYAHLDELTIPYAVGDSVEESDIVGLLVDFPVTGFVHCHFARITDSGATWNGGWWTFDNPLSYITNFFDSISPQFEKTINNDAFAFRKTNGTYLSPDSLYGNVQVISKVYDRINADWHSDVNKLRYNLSPLASPQILLLDTFAYEYNFFTDVYPAGSYNSEVIDIIYSRDANCFSTGDYSIRDFYHIVTNSDGNDTINSNDALQVFNTQNFQDGSYIFRVIASDPSGNTSLDSMIIQIKNSAASVAEPTSDNGIVICPSLSENGKFEIDLNDKNEIQSCSVFNSIGERIVTFKNVLPVFTIDLSSNKSGVYVICFETREKNVVRRVVKL